MDMKLTRRLNLSVLGMVAGATFVATGASAATVCVWDILGANGPVASMVKDYTLNLQKQNIDLKVKTYTDESVAVADFKTGQCDAVMATTVRLRGFVPMAGSIDTLGSTSIIRGNGIDMPASYQVVQEVIKTFASPAAAKMMVNGDYETAGLIPLGAAVPILSDRKYSSVEGLAGSKLPAMDYDKAQAAMIKRIGAQPVSVDLLTIGPKFNNGQLSAVFLPLAAFRPFELYKGVGKKGAVVRFPVLISTYQMVVRHAKFPADFGLKSRTYWLGRYNEAMRYVKNAEKDVPTGTWMDLPPGDAVKYTLMLRDARIDLAGDGMYDKRGLKVVKKVRCKINPTDSECVSKEE
jgi:hypothetical protein